MNKYTLQFKDQIMEQKFQQTHQIPTRKLHIKIILITYLLLQILKLFEGILQQRNQVLYIIPALITFTIILICFPPTKSITQNLVISFVNLSFTVYVLYFDEQDGMINQYFKAGNHMIFCFVNLLLTEFIEAALMSVILFGLRSSFYITQSTNFDPITFILGLIVNVGFIYIQYNYRKAQRAQYLLSQANFKWERILKQLMNQQEFLVLLYDENKNSFNNLIFSSSTHFQKQENILDFLRNSQITQISLEKYLHSEIIKFQSNFNEIYNQQLFLKYKKKAIQVNFSLFFGSRPTILIVFQTLSHTSQQLIKKYNQVNKLLKFIVKISKLIDYTRINPQFKILKILVSMQIQYHQLQILSSSLLICVIRAHKVFQYLQSVTKCKIKTFFDFNLQINTIPNIFYLLILLIIDCSNKHQLIVIAKYYEDKLVLLIRGNFNLINLQSSIKKNKLFLMSIIDIQNLIINQTCKFFNKQGLEIKFQKEIFMPYLSLGDKQYENQNLFQSYKQFITEL